MQLCREVGVVAFYMFQSSSYPKVGCNELGGEIYLNELLVSILILPEGRMQHERSLRHQDVELVSILILPEGRMQRLNS